MNSPWKADQATGRDAVFDTDATATVRHHVLQVALALTEAFHDATLSVFFDVDGQLFVRLALNTVDRLLDDARTTDCQLVAFAAHVFEQDAEVQFATPGDVEHIAVRRCHARAAPCWSAVPCAGGRESGGW
jgi:hypothetical protein